MSTGPYFVQCISGNDGHIMEAIPGSELEAQCMAREAKGFIGALCLGYDDCPDCVREASLREHENWKILGCPWSDIYGNCKDDCTCKTMDHQVPVSRYANQVQYPSNV